ncbi:MAG: hypothetical protein ACI9MC_001142 [Kiritimatiellia bacterium]|jgi:hypothetical protein
MRKVFLRVATIGLAASPLLLILTTSNVAFGQSEVTVQRVPERKVPASVLTEVRLLDNRFDNALASDCDPSRCFSKGCTYVGHAVADRPRRTSLPGLGQDAAPSAVEAQEYLTEAHCAFTHERTVSARDVASLSRRLQDKLSSGWTVVTVSHQRLPPIPAYLQEPPDLTPDPPDETEEIEDTDVAEPAEAPPAELTLGTAIEDLWATLLPHFFWMIAVVMGTIAGALLIWAWRRVGRETLEEKMLLAELGRGEPESAESAEPSDATVELDDAEVDALYVNEQAEVWGSRLQAIDAEHPDRVLQALIRERLAAGDLALLAKAVLTFPDTFPAAFPEGSVGGELATAKVALAEYLRDMPEDVLLDDAAFFRSLNRHTLSAAVACQNDAHTMRSLRDDFGTTGLANLLGELHARPAALLFALAPASAQVELVRIIDPQQLSDMADALLRSNRMSPEENSLLSSILTQARQGGTPTWDGLAVEVSDRGETFNAASPLSILLEGLRPERRAALFGAALDRLHGSLADWTRDIVVSDMLQLLDSEARADLLLGISVEPLTAWLSLLDRESQVRVLEGMPSSLQNSVRASAIFPSRAVQLTLAERGRQELAPAFQAQLARAGVSFEHVVAGTEG